MSVAVEMDAVVEELRSAQKFLLTTHENPDGDALGSLLAMTLALRQLGKNAYMYLAGHAPLPVLRHRHRARGDPLPALHNRALGRLSGLWTVRSAFFAQRKGLETQHPPWRAKPDLALALFRPGHAASPG